MIYVCCIQIGFFFVKLVNVFLQGTWIVHLGDTMEHSFITKRIPLVMFCVK